MPRWYQNVGIPDVTYEGTERAESAYWNEGKWYNFIRPFLPSERQVFVEIGCNAGLMLHQAREEGYQYVVGVEPNRGRMQQAEQYRAHVGGEWDLVQATAGADLDLHSLPLADVVLLANVHYYIPLNAFIDLVDALRHRTLYLILVSARVRRRGGKALYDLNSVRGYFRDWQEMGTIERVDVPDDPAPRGGMYSVLFRGNLHAPKVSAAYGNWRAESLASRKDKHNRLPAALEEFFRLSLWGEPFEQEDTLLHQYWIDREGRARDLTGKRDLARAIRAQGIREPIVYDRRGQLMDGLSRLCIAHTLKLDHIPARRL